MSNISEFPYFKDIRTLARRKRCRVYLIGGFLRDYVLDRETMDFDFAVERNALAFAKHFAKKIHGVFVLLDEDHGCGRVVKRRQNKIATYDFADFRDATLKGDLKHRDFRLNTLSLCLNDWNEDDAVEEHMKDFCGALKDIKDQCVRYVSARAFEEDPLRLLRAYALSAQLGFKIDEKTVQRIRRDRDLIKNVSVERVREELFKILESGRAAKTLRAMDRVGLLEKVIPQIRVMFKVKQGGYHHLDVWRHALETVAQAEKYLKSECCPREADYFFEVIAGGHSRKALFLLACLLHDIGKPDVLKKEGARSIFHGHEHAGKNITKFIARDLKLSIKEKKKLLAMIEMHLRPGYLSNFKRPSDKAIFRYFRDAGEEAVSIAVLALADQRATRGPLTSQSDVEHQKKVAQMLIQKYFEQLDRKPYVPLITGRDLIQILKLKPSPLFSKILISIREAQETGKVSTKKEAVSLARTLAEKERA